MILFKSYRRLYFKFFATIDERRHWDNKNIEVKLQSIALNETVEYIIQNMENVYAVSSTFELYDFVLSKITVKEGLFCEFGVWQGTSINYMAKQVDGKFHGFDSFEGLPEFWRGGFKEGAFNLNGSLPKVENNVVLHKGWFEETLPSFVHNHQGPLALLHIDSDLYSSARTIFTFFNDRIVEGTIIIFDEYFNFPFWKTQEFKAFQEFISESGWKYDYLCYNQFHEQVAVKIKR